MTGGFRRLQAVDPGGMIRVLARRAPTADVTMPSGRLHARNGYGMIGVPGGVAPV